MNPGSLALALFVTISIIYFMIKYYIGNKGNFMIWNLIYYVLVIITMFSINVNTTKSNCGFPSYGIAALATVIPWMIIFGLLNIMLLMFPGWLSPFSNTFGYLLAKLNGVSDTLDNIFKNKMVKKDAPADLQNASEALEHIYSNKSLLLNEITIQNFSDFWTRMTPLFKSDANNYKGDLFNFVRMKTIVSEFVWYVLTGGLITTMSYNYILNSGCNPNPKQMNKNYNNYKDDLSSKKKPERKVYNL
jgi:hypothetical protein